MKKYLCLLNLLIISLVCYSQPCISYITYDVISDNNIIYWGYNSSPYILEYKIYREDSTSNYIQIGQAGPLDSMYNDTTINPFIQYARYKYKVISIYGESALTPFCGSVFLNVNAGSNQNINTLNWNKYICYCGAPIKYYILKGHGLNSLSILDSIISTDPIHVADTIPMTYLSYIDSNSYSGVYYQIGYSINTYTQGLTIGYSNYNNVQNTSVKKFDMEKQISIYPNPFSDYTTIFFKNREHKMTIIITDILGKTIRIYYNIIQEKFVIQKENFNPGLYFINILGDRIEKYKLVVE